MYSCERTCVATMERSCRDRIDEVRGQWLPASPGVSMRSDREISRGPRKKTHLVLIKRNTKCGRRGAKPERPPASPESIPTPEYRGR